MSLVGKSPQSNLNSLSPLYNAFSRHPTGTPFYVDTCQSTCGWVVGDGATFATTTAVGEGFNGVQGFKLTTPAAGIGTLLRFMGVPHHKKLGMEINFAFKYTPAELIGVLNYFTFGFSYQQFPGTLYHAGATYYPNVPYTNADTHSVWRDYFVPTVHKFLDLTNLETGHVGGICTWQNAKIIVNLDTLMFDRFYWNELEADISSVPFGVETQGGIWNEVYAFIRVSDNGPPIDCFLGNIILSFE